MTESLPSKRFALVDMPEVANFNAEFKYNFFTPDEKNDDSGIASAESIRSRSTGNFDSSFVDSINFNRFIPRFVKLNWTPKAELGRQINENPPSIQNNFSKIHNEQTFATVDYTNMIFQDNGRDRKLQHLLKRALEEIRGRQEPNKNESPLDIAKFLAGATDKRVGPRFLTESLAHLFNSDVTFLDENGQERVTEGLLKEISSVRVRAQINNKVISYLLKTVSKNTLNLFDDETEGMLTRASEIQESAVSQESSTILRGSDYDLEILDFIDVCSVDTNNFEPTSQIIGYVIDKQEHVQEGQPIDHDPIIVENPFANTTVDLKVRYGTTYTYAIRSIGIVEIQAEDTDTNDVLAISFLVSSRPSQRIVVTTEEFVPPPPPSDFNISFDYRLDALRLMWNFPVNTQRDIKHFQVFRRLSISEPFELIKQFSFDDSEIPAIPRETPDPALIEVLDSPKNFYIDREFTRDSVFTYAVCAIDAHSFSSNYSIQFEISFNKFKNKIEKTVVSLSGAPKAYPNAFILSDTFVDTIRDSGHKKLKVVFNPEFLQVLDSKNNDLKLIKADNDSKYQIQLINTDLQEQRVIDISIADRRTTADKNKT